MPRKIKCISFFYLNDYTCIGTIQRRRNLVYGQADQEASEHRLTMIDIFNKSSIYFLCFFQLFQINFNYPLYVFVVGFFFFILVCFSKTISLARSDNTYVVTGVFDKV